MHKDRGRRLRLGRPVASVVLLVLAISALSGTAAALGAAPIVGVWSFNGGEIAVQEVQPGEFEGTVVKETKFAECAHPVGQRIWTDMVQQPDGSYWGLHKWYYEGSSCTLNPTLGKTAWRVDTEASGTTLEACFSYPGTTQPTISASGTVSGATYSPCVRSALLATVKGGTADFKALVTGLPSANKCLSRRAFRIHVHDPHNDAFKSVRITIAGHTLKTYRKGEYLIANVNLKGLPKGVFTLRIDGVTFEGRHLHGKRVYHTCVAGSKSVRHRST